MNMEADMVQFFTGQQSLLALLGFHVSLGRILGCIIFYHAKCTQCSTSIYRSGIFGTSDWSFVILRRSD